ncbi:MAG: flagellar motor switch phosphatase FliY [Anaerotignum sp.]|nr:flagellar motor switch phosphatase FliY [Anaerotignum sp.]
MIENVFNSLEMDAIGEILNISLGASATAVSTMLDRRVDITVPNVMISSKENFEFTYMEPAVAVEITYVSGLSGSNIMLLKRHDVKVIVEILMGMEIPDEEFELNEINLSAICEVMNQMMGASSTALAEMLGEPINISTPHSFEIKTVAEFSEKYLKDDLPMVVVRFSLKVEDSLESEFLNIMTTDLARKMLSCLGFAEPEPAKPEEPTPQVEAQQMSYQSFDQPEVPSDAAPGRMMSQEEIEKLLAQSFQSNVSNDAPPAPPAPPSPQIMQNNTVPPRVEQTPVKAVAEPTPAPQINKLPEQPRIINVKPHTEGHNPAKETLGQERSENLDLIMGVPLEISVEIGRTKKNVREILEFNKGSLIVLDKLAGEQVDIYVNGQCIAKGDVVVVEDNFGVRVTEVLKKL